MKCNMFKNEPFLRKKRRFKKEVVFWPPLKKVRQFSFFSLSDFCTLFAKVKLFATRPPVFESLITHKRIFEGVTFHMVSSLHFLLFNPWVSVKVDPTVLFICRFGLGLGPGSANVHFSVVYNSFSPEFNLFQEVQRSFL